MRAWVVFLGLATVLKALSICFTMQSLYSKQIIQLTKLSSKLWHIKKKKLVLGNDIIFSFVFFSSNVFVDMEWAISQALMCFLITILLIEDLGKGSWEMIMAIIGGHFYKRARTRTRRRHLRFRDESIRKELPWKWITCPLLISLKHIQHYKMSAWSKKTP